MTDIPESQIPELLRQRLQISAETASDAEHPDPNLLAAYAEQSLRGAERAGVVEHLSHCQPCREVAALSLPPVAEAMASRPMAETTASPRGGSARRRNWFADENLLWARLAATVTLAIGIGITYYAVHDRRAELEPAPAITAPSSREAKSQSQGLTKSPSAAAKTQPMIAGDEKKSAAVDATEQSPHSPRETDQITASAGTQASPARHEDKDSGAAELSKKRIAHLPAPPPAANARLSAAQTVDMSTDSSPPGPANTLKDKANSPTGNVAIAAERSSAVKTDTLRQDAFRTAVADGTAKLGGSGGANAGAAGGVLAPQSARAGQQAAVSQQPAASQTVTVLNQQVATDGQEPATPPTQQSQPLKTISPRPRARFGASQPEMRDKMSAGSISATRWTISPLGRLQKMTVGTSRPLKMSSNTETAGSEALWTDVRVGEGVVFRAVAVIGANVWAGGSGHQLFYSRDDGMHWKRVGGQWQGDITSIRFSDLLHGELQTFAGERWITLDGGEHWRVGGSAP